MDFEMLLKRSLPVRPATLTGIVYRCNVISLHIKERFGVDEPYQYKVKHLRWFLENKAMKMSPATRLDYGRTVRSLAAALGHWQDWQIHLRGPWLLEGKGRPPKLPRRPKV